MQLIEGYEACRAALEQSNAARAFGSFPEIEATVREICEAVRSEGDEAVARYERQFDFAGFDIADVRVTQAEIEAAWQSLPTNAQNALQRAADNIEAFHRKQPGGDWHMTSPDGAFLGQRYTPIERAGLYAPNARAALPSSVLMVAMPARVAGVREIVLFSPPSRNGSLHSVILAAARVAGITEIYKVGGAVAIAAMAYGTASIPRVDKIVGPANIYGTLAKKHVFGAVGIDGLYGPSDVVILCDDQSTGQSTLSAQIAADLVAQAEHGADSWVCLICTSRALAEDVLTSLNEQVQSTPRREIVEQSLPHGLVLCVDDVEQMCELGNLAAAEHMEIWSHDALGLSGRIRHAGAIFLNTPVPLGDYIIGPSHALPTGGTARFSHGVDVGTFLKRTSLIAAPQSTLQALATDLEIIALLEDLPGHAAAARRAAQKG
jgi:histidinol dehydrogenase